MNKHLNYVVPQTHANAVFTACDDKYAFCLYVSLSTFIANSPLLASQSDLFVAGYQLSDSSRQALVSLPGVRVLDYAYPSILPDTPAIRNFTAASFARYDCFALLARYEKVLYLDSAVLVRQELAGVFDGLTTGIGLTIDPLFDTVRGQFFKSIEGFDMTRTGFNSGFIALCRQKNLASLGPEIMDWCYQMTAQWAENLFLPDQGIINLALERFHLDAAILPEKYNCPASASLVKLKTASIIHSTGPRKFWCYYYFDDFYHYYSCWIAAGGQPVTVRKGDSSFYKWFIKKSGLERKIFFQLCPDFFTKPLKALRFLLKKILRLPY